MTVAAVCAELGYSGDMDASQISWPQRYSPQRAPVHVVNALTLSSSPARVWAKLIGAAGWPQFYANASNVVIEGGARELFAGAHFTWRTFGVNLKTQVIEFQPCERIAWLATSPGVEAYHAWLIRPLPDGCQVITEETQYGLAARAARVLFPHRMEQWHQRWLEGLAKAAAS